MSAEDDGLEDADALVDRGGIPAEAVGDPHVGVAAAGHEAERLVEALRRRQVLAGEAPGQVAEVEAVDEIEELAEAAPNPVTRDDLITAVWGERYVSDEVLTHAIKELRHALGDSPTEPQYIQTIPKRGYRLLKKPRPIDAPTPVSEGRERRYLVIAASLVLVVVAFGWFVVNLARNAEPTEAAFEADEVTVSGINVKPSKRIAVLSFADLSPDGDQEYFSDGISEEILNLLAQIRALKVIARQSSFS